jgi:hypothetical protein
MSGQIPQSEQPSRTISDANLKSNTRGGGKYQVQQHTFPSDLFTAGPAKYANSWMMININAMEQSKFFDKYPAATLSDAEQAEIRRRETVSDVRNNSVEGAIGNAATSGAAIGVASNIGNLKLQSFFSGNKAARQQALVGAASQLGARAVTGGVTGAAAVGFAVGTAGTAVRETKRIAAAIQLPMPNNLVTVYNARWGDDPTNMFDLMMRGLGNLTTGVTDAAAAASLGANAIMQNQGLSAATGLAANPKREMYFDSVGFRHFSLMYKLYAKTPQEAQAIRSITDLLKFHMHPEYKSAGRYTFVYPSEFDITFYHKTDENLWINKVATCVLTDLNVNYTPDGLWAQHSGGEPNAIELQMAFRELTVLTKETILSGF